MGDLRFFENKNFRGFSLEIPFCEKSHLLGKLRFSREFIQEYIFFGKSHFWGKVIFWEIEVFDNKFSANVFGRKSFLGKFIFWDGGEVLEGSFT